MISFIIPAHNEQALIAGTVAALREAAGALAQPWEIVVADDASTDETGAIAARLGATIVRVDRRQIAAVRNEGARAARGDVLVFVDADTIVTAGVLRGMTAALERGAVGGGARIVFERGVPRWSLAAITTISWLMARFRLAAGCFLFTRRDAFERAGGFDERYFASEEVHLSRALSAQGAFVILPETVVTSGRKTRMFSARTLLWYGVQMLWLPNVRRRERLGLWYDGRRE